MKMSGAGIYHNIILQFKESRPTYIAMHNVSGKNSSSNFVEEEREYEGRKGRRSRRGRSRVGERLIAAAATAAAMRALPQLSECSLQAACSLASLADL